MIIRASTFAVNSSFSNRLERTRDMQGDLRMLLSQRRSKVASRARVARRLFLKDLRKDQSGGIIILSLLLLITMLVMSGMAVDFMRYESKRAQLQSVSDRAVLAAAELDQTHDPKLVVTDFFQTAGFGDNVVGEPFVESSNGSRSVRVDSEIDVETFYLRFVGIDTLSAPAKSSAIEGQGNVEVSLILDISGSMGNWVSSERKTKMTLLQEAATSFIDGLLKPEYEDQMSINLVSYSQHVAIGDELYRALNTTPDTLFEDGTTSSSQTDAEELFDEDGNPITEEASSPDTDSDVAEDDAIASFTNPSRCVDFLPAEYETTTFNTRREYQQVERFQHYKSDQPVMNYPVCPDQSFEGIIPLSQDADLLKETINDLRPTSYTSIHLGMKWGVSLLDPSMRDLLAGLDIVDDEFAGHRPGDYSDNQTVKYVILMTDGENVRGHRIKPTHYNTVEWRQTWDTYPLDWWRNNVSTASRTPPRRSVASFEVSNATVYDGWMQSTCKAARDAGMTVFTIAMGAGAGSRGEQEMLKCASSPSHAFKTNFSNNPNDGEAGGIDEIFDKIAKQITDLRLSL